MENLVAIVSHFSNIEKVLYRLKSEKMSEYGLRHSHLMCMVQIGISPEGLTPTELAIECNFDKAFVSRILADLIYRKFIKVNEKYNDGRKYKQKFILSEDGIAVISEINVLIRKIADNVIEKVSKSDLETFYKILMIISENINSSEEEA